MAASPSRLPIILVWLVRAGWVAVGVLGSSAVAEAVAGRSSTVRGTAYAVAGVVWMGGVVGVAVPAVVTLVVLRVFVPLAVPGTALAWATGAPAATGAAALGAAVITSLVAASGDVGHAYVQASAYGDEQRFALRPPPGYLLAALVAWVLAATGLLAGPLLLAHGQWLGGVLLTLLIGAGVFAWPRWYRLARRWLVVVPAGLVIHDHLVLAETLMVRRRQLADVALAPAGTTAADLTGPAPGHALQITTHESVTAIYAATPSEPRGKSIHLTACLVSPTRPGRALAASRG